MSTRAREIQVGVTVLVALGVTLWAATWLKEQSLTRQVREWLVTFPQTGGLSRSDEVQVNGLRKGNVSRVDLVGDHVLVRLALSSEITLTSDSHVAIRNIGLMGEKVIAVDLKATGVPYTARDTIAGIYERGIPEVVASLGSTIDAVAELSTQLRNIAGAMEQNGTLDRTLANFRNTSEELKLAVSQNRAVLDETLANLRATSRTAKALTTDREAQLRHTLDSFERSAASMERLTGQLDSLRASIQSVSGKVDRGEGTLGKLVNDQKLYDDARESVSQLHQLIEDIKKNPKKYISLRVF